MKQTEINTDKTCDFIEDKFLSSELDNDSLVQIIELCGSMLNLSTISNYAKENNMSYNGVKKCRCLINLFGVKLVLDNE